jgi:transcriptional regulator with XRE-family HTH domain
MTTLLSKLLDEELKRRGLSIRQAASEMDVAHTTLMRLLDGDMPNLDTAIKAARWLGVQPASIINAEGVGSDALASQIAAVLEMEPAMSKVFEEAMGRVRRGDMSPSTFRDLANYAAYRLNLSDLGEQNEQHDGTQQDTRNTSASRSIRKD